MLARVQFGAVREPVRRFWEWYEDHYVLTTGIAVGLFLLQLVHLYWLTADVVATRLIGVSFFSPTPLWRTVILFVDYTEIPAILSVSLVYLNDLRKSFDRKPAMYLLALNLQWLHIFWITDEFVVGLFVEGGGTGFPVWFAWIAICIDYLELPVMAETILKFLAALEAGEVREMLQDQLRNEERRK